MKKIPKKKKKSRSWHLPCSNSVEARWDLLLKYWGSALVNVERADCTRNLVSSAAQVRKCSSEHWQAIGSLVQDLLLGMRRNKAASHIKAATATYFKSTQVIITFVHQAMQTAVRSLILTLFHQASSGPACVQATNIRRYQWRGASLCTFAVKSLPDHQCLDYCVLIQLYHLMIGLQSSIGCSDAIRQTVDMRSNVF